jgi:glycerol uptake facilitator-like aquaporin
MAEMTGTILLVLCGCASVAHYKIVKEDPTNNPIFLTINLSFGFGLTLGILLTAKISGI